MVAHIHLVFLLADEFVRVVFKQHFVSWVHEKVYFSLIF